MIYRLSGDCIFFLNAVESGRGVSLGRGRILFRFLGYFCFRRVGVGGRVLGGGFCREKWGSFRLGFSGGSF